MKKLFSKVSLMVMLICLFHPVFSQPRAGQEKYKEFKVALNGVNFTVDPRIELFHTVELLQGIYEVNSIDLDYKQKIATNFDPYKNHPLFAYLNRNPLYGKIFNTIDEPIAFLIHLTNDFDWRKDATYQYHKNPYMDSLRVLMKDFSIKSNYPKFFNGNADFYNVSLVTLTYNLPNFDEKNRLLRYCGDQNRKDLEFNVILNFLGWGNFGPHVVKKNSTELYAVITPEKTALLIPTFDIGALYRLLWHEFAHSFANPAVETVRDQFAKLDYLWEPVKDSMKAKAYHTWDAVVHEHLTEAVACRLAAQKFGEDAGEMNFIRNQKGSGWLYLYPLLEDLKYYEANRKIYPTLNSFMPKIIASFKAIKQSDIEGWKADAEQIRKPDVDVIPMVGDIYKKKNILFIVSSNEQDRVADEKLKKFMKEFKNNISSIKEATIVSDTTALNMDLSPYNLYVWGTPKGNKFLQKYLSEVPLLIKDNEIVGEKIFEGTGYGVLIGWVSPFNNKNIMAVCTGQNPANMVGFNGIIHGWGNYHIFRNHITIKQGNFNRQGGVWLAR